jgi:hypothetical protein
MSPQAAVRLLIGLLVLGLVLYAIWLLLAFLPIPEPFRTIVLIILVLVALGFLLNWSGLWAGGPP